MSTTGRNIRAYRTLHQLTQKQLGVLVGFPEEQAQRRVQSWEVGRHHPSTHYLYRLSSALQCSIEELITHERKILTPKGDIVTFRVEKLRASDVITITWTDAEGEHISFSRKHDRAPISDDEALYWLKSLTWSDFLEQIDTEETSIDQTTLLDTAENQYEDFIHIRDDGKWVPAQWIDMFKAYLQPLSRMQLAKLGIEKGSLVSPSLNDLNAFISKQDAIEVAIGFLTTKKSVEIS